MHLKLPYGRGFQEVELTKEATVLRTRRHELPALSRDDLAASLESSFRRLRLGKVVAVAVPDHTRPNVLRMILPKIVEIITKGGAREIRVCVGTGLHRPPTPVEMKELIPQEVTEHPAVRILVHDACEESNLAFLGYTSFGTQVWIMKDYYEADTKIAISLVEAHQFAGFSGGAKAVAIGLGGERTISGNHSKLTHPNATIGRIQENPVKEEIDEIGKMVGIDLLVNVVLNDGGAPTRLFCGAHPTAHLAACEFLRSVSGVVVEELYDVVIASPGGYPRDIDLYQAQKALTVAEAFCKPGGIVILVAECDAGYGEGEYVELLKKAGSPDSLMKGFDFSHFKVGPHKAYLLARTLSRYEVRIVSRLPPDELKELFFIPQSTLEDAVKSLPRKTKVLVIPNTSQVIPIGV